MSHRRGAIIENYYKGYYLSRPPTDEELEAWCKRQEEAGKEAEEMKARSSGVLGKRKREENLEEGEDGGGEGDVKKDGGKENGGEKGEADVEGKA